MIADIAQSIREVVRVAMGMAADSVRPEGQLSGDGTQVQRVATVKIIEALDVGWPALTRENVDNTAASAVTENVDQLKKIVASVNFYRGGNADKSGMAAWTLRAMDDASRVGQRLRMSPTFDLVHSLGLVFVEAGKPRDLTGLQGGIWKSRGQVELSFYIVNRESSQVPSVGTGSVTMMVDSKTKNVEVPA